MVPVPTRVTARVENAQLLVPEPKQAMVRALLAAASLLARTGIGRKAVEKGLRSLRISGTWQRSPVHHSPVTVEAALDGEGRVAVELPLDEARVLSVGPEVELFLEPGDDLHVEADLADLPGSLRFSGRGAANNRFLAAMRARFPDHPRIDYEDLEVDAHRKLVDQRRRELESFLDEGCSRYQLTPGFVAHHRAEITYEWANELVSYPMNYERRNGRESALPEDYHDILDEIELVDESAIGATPYRHFLERNFLRLWLEKVNRPDVLRDLKRMSDEERNAFRETWSDYNQARKSLHGRVLYFFLAGEIVSDFQSGRFEQGDRRLAEFTRENPHPEYTEAVEEVIRATAALRPGRPAPGFTLEDPEGRSVSLNDFRGKAVFLDFWASWCGPCVDAAPPLEEIKERTRDLPVVFLNVSLDGDDDWREAIDELGLTGLHVRAPGGWQAEAMRAYQVQGIPAYFLVDPEGRIAGRIEHLLDVPAVVARIEEALSGKPPAWQPRGGADHPDRRRLSSVDR